MAFFVVAFLRLLLGGGCQHQLCCKRASFPKRALHPDPEERADLAELEHLVKQALEGVTKTKRDPDLIDVRGSTCTGAVCTDSVAKLKDLNTPPRNPFSYCSAGTLATLHAMPSRGGAGVLHCETFCAHLLQSKSDNVMGCIISLTCFMVAVRLGYNDDSAPLDDWDTELAVTWRSSSSRTCPRASHSTGAQVKAFQHQLGRLL